MFGYSEAEVIGRPIVADRPAEQAGRAGETLRAAQAGRAASAPFETMRWRKDGPADRRLGRHLAHHATAAGQLVGASGIFRDITRAQAGARRRCGRRCAARTSSSPMLEPRAAQPAGADAQLPGRDPAARSARRAGRAAAPQIMDRQLAHMTALVDQLMDASRIASGKIDAGAARRGPDRGGALRRRGPAARSWRRACASSCSCPNRPLWMRGDELRLSQIVANLIGNAAKFTEPGGTVTVSLASEDDRQAALSVRDTGVGLRRSGGARSLPALQAVEQPGPARSEGGWGWAWRSCARWPRRTEAAWTRRARARARGRRSACGCR